MMISTQSSLELGRRVSDTGCMITLLAIAIPVAIMDVLALRFGADTRPGFDERKPLV